MQGRWYFVFRRAWGDCPSGCIDQELFFFTVVDGEAAPIEPAQGHGMEWSGPLGSDSFMRRF